MVEHLNLKDKQIFKGSEQIIKIAIVLISFYFIIAFVFAGWSRLYYPYDLEWMEGGQVEHTARILEGKQIYIQPSIEFIPYIYTPLYPYITALTAKITGMGYFPLRLISYASTQLTFLLIWLLVKKETQSKFAAFSAVGLYAATYQISGFWFDLARVDSLFLLFYVASIYFLRKEQNLGNILISCLLMFLSYFTKQTALLFFIPVAVYLFITKSRFKWLYPAVYLVLIISSTLIFNVLTNGWYYFWNFGLPSSHHWNMKYLISFWSGDLIKPLGIALLFSFFIYFLIEKKEKYFILMFFIGSFLVSWLTRLHYGGFLNSLMPAYLFIAVGFGLFISKIEKQDFLSLPNNQLLRTFFYMLILFQFINLSYNPLKALPQKQDKIYGDKLISKVRTFGGDVWIPCHSYISRYAGKESFCHAMVLYDLMISKSEIKNPVKSEIVNQLKNHRFSAIILNSDWQKEHIPGLAEYYYMSETVYTDETGFFTVTGHTRPNLIFLPKKNTP